MSDHYEAWRKLQSDALPITPDREADIFTWTTIYGTRSGWTGTLGTAAAMMRELLREVARLRQSDATKATP